jgi:hypothetical protein
MTKEELYGECFALYCELQDSQSISIPLLEDIKQKAAELNVMEVRQQEIQARLRGIRENITNIETNEKVKVTSQQNLVSLETIGRELKVKELVGNQKDIYFTLQQKGPFPSSFYFLTYTLEVDYLDQVKTALRGLKKKGLVKFTKDIGWEIIK